MNRCGIFDSGIGGISVAKEILKAKLFDEIIYFGDTARVPYGNKNESTIIRYSLEALEFLKNFDIDFLIVACNTASAVAVEELRREASFPVLGVIEAGVEAIKNEDKNANILLVGTKRTIKSGKYQKLLKKQGFKNITSIPTPLFVPLVEEGLVEGEITDKIFNMYFESIDKEKIDIVILGCTHYPFLEKTFKKHFPNAKLIHSGQAIVKLLTNQYKLNPKKSTSIKLFSSDAPDEFKNQARKLLSF